MDTATYTILGGDYAGGGAASKGLKELLKKIGVNSQAVRRTMIAAYEAEMNVVIHAHRGSMKAAVDPTQVDVAVTDEGPGIPDIGKAMQEGFSTAPAEARDMGFGAGMGLPNIQRNSDRFSIHSTVGQGTQVRFTILLNSEAASSSAPNSVHVEPSRCRQCLACLPACPTAAIRIRDAQPHIIEHLCIDCTSCIAACEARALTLQFDPGMPAPSDDTLLVLPVSFLEQFGPNAPPEKVLGVLKDMGWRHIRLSEEWEDALRKTVLQYVEEDRPHAPVLSPVCPAVVNLIQVRFPSLIGNLAPFRTSIEAAREELVVPHVVFMPVCPSQQTLLRSPGLLSKIDIISPAALLKAVAARAAVHDRALPHERIVATEAQQILQVSGMRHVTNILDAVENGRMQDYSIIELYACDQGCFGSPVWTEDPFVARPRWARMGGTVPSAAKSIRRTAPLAVRAGLRLDADMKRSIEKLARMDAITKSLPGRNCGVCGAPTCAALAEDVVLGRAEIAACVYRETSRGEHS